MVVTLGQQLSLPGASGAKIGVPALTSAFSEGNAVVLIRLLLRAQAAAAEHHATAVEARKRGAKEIANLAAEAAALEGRLAKHAAELAAKLGKAGK
jgi:hypothetical protein